MSEQTPNTPLLDMKLEKDGSVSVLLDWEHKFNVAWAEVSEKIRLFLDGKEAFITAETALMIVQILISWSEWVQIIDDATVEKRKAAISDFGIRSIWIRELKEGFLWIFDCIWENWIRDFSQDETFKEFLDSIELTSKNLAKLSLGSLWNSNQVKFILALLIQRELQKSRGMGWRQAGYLLKALEDKGYVSYENGKYIIEENNREWCTLDNFFDAIKWEDERHSSFPSQFWPKNRELALEILSQATN